MVVDVVMTVIAAILIVVAAIGAIYPVMPGSPIAMVALIAWGWVLGSAAAWTTALVGLLLCVIGFSGTLILTGRTMKKYQVPRRSILIAAVGGIIGMFVIPVAGLFVGFAAGLFASEYARVHDLRAAATSAGSALVATGLGVLVEFGMVCLAGSVWMIGVIIHFSTR